MSDKLATCSGCILRNLAIRNGICHDGSVVDPRRL